MSRWPDDDYVPDLMVGGGERLVGRREVDGETELELPGPFGVPGDPEADERLRADLAEVRDAEQRARRG